MKRNLLSVTPLPAVSFTLKAFCSASNEMSNVKVETQVDFNYDYSAIELEVIKLINNYRISSGLSPLKLINYLSIKSEEHNISMITNNLVNHNGFEDRSKNIIKMLAAKTVGENIAFNYNKPKAVFNAWLDSQSHKENIVGNFTHCGISIRENAATDKKYYTNIFAKI